MEKLIALNAKNSVSCSVCASNKFMGVVRYFAYYFFYYFYFYGFLKFISKGTKHSFAA